MQLRLKVIGGKNDGREIEIKGEFVIGRGEGVNLRPKSDLISRKHCALYVRDGRAYVNDLNSSNGTFLNGEPIKGEHKLDIRDRLRVGRLQFEVVLDHAKPSAKRPKVSNVRDAAVRSASAGNVAQKADMEESITDWLTEVDDPSKSAPKSDQSDQTDQSETRQFRLDESDRLYVPESSPTKPDAALDETVDNAGEESVDSSAEEVEDQSKKKGKKVLGKLKERPGDKTDNSTDAASQMLRKFFNRS